MVHSTNKPSSDDELPFDVRARKLAAARATPAANRQSRAKRRRLLAGGAATVAGRPLSATYQPTLSAGGGVAQPDFRPISPPPAPSTADFMMPPPLLIPSPTPTPSTSPFPNPSPPATPMTLTRSGAQIWRRRPRSLSIASPPPEGEEDEQEVVVWVSSDSDSATTEADEERVLAAAVSSAIARAERVLRESAGGNDRRADTPYPRPRLPLVTLTEGMPWSDLSSIISGAQMSFRLWRARLEAYQNLVSSSAAALDLLTLDVDSNSEC